LPTLVRRLVILNGEHVGRVRILENRPIVLGREGFVESDEGLGLKDGEVSKRHATVSSLDDAFVVTDAKSRNGTFKCGRRVDTAPLVNGDVIRVGATLVLFQEVSLLGSAPLVAECEGLLGPSLGLSRVRGEVELVATQRSPVLVLGETGAGKELVAELIHRRSGRTGPFVPVNCASISPQLAESEFFGHAQGSFTGASKRGEGLFQAAAGGTLFLDEVGELPLELQPKLLRAVGKGEVRPVGATDAVQVDVRIVAATHRDLAREVTAGRFREDLLARLGAWIIQLPPLRERREDILALAERFLAAQGSPKLSPDAAEALVLHSWPQNVRELEAVVTSARIRSAGSPIRREHLPPAIAALLLDRRFAEVPPAQKAALPLEVLIPRHRPPSKDELLMVLKHAAGNVAEVAEFFGKDRRQIYRWAERLGIALETIRDAPT
jgi:transcriptional regulator with GAF, ATPase, and Fis domain